MTGTLMKMAQKVSLAYYLISIILANIRTVPEYKIKFYYNVGSEGLIGKDNIRAPAEGLQAVFGMRPWLWQQFTLLQLEKRLRFDADHEDDFDEIDNLRFGKLRWDAWLHADGNADFKDRYDSLPAISRVRLFVFFKS